MPIEIVPETDEPLVIFKYVNTLLVTHDEKLGATVGRALGAIVGIIVGRAVGTKVGTRIG